MLFSYYSEHRNRNYKLSAFAPPFFFSFEKFIQKSIRQNQEIIRLFPCFFFRHYGNQSAYGVPSPFFSALVRSAFYQVICKPVILQDGVAFSRGPVDINFSAFFCFLPDEINAFFFVFLNPSEECRVIFFCEFLDRKSV